MTNLEALLLGLIQGLTEFLPISSSGHLVIFQQILGFSQPPVAYDVLLHLATLIATVLFFRKEILKIDVKMTKKILFGLLPTGIIGLFLNNYSQQLFSSLDLVGVALLVTTFVLLSTKFIKKKATNSDVNKKTALLVGLAQGLAVIPGISRSGTTIVTGLWLGLNSAAAVSFSFLLSIPAILGAQLIELPNLVNNSQIGLDAYFIGFVTALISGWFSLGWLKVLVQRSKIHYFAIYTLLLSLAIFFS